MHVCKKKEKSFSLPHTYITVGEVIFFVYSPFGGRGQSAEAALIQRLWSREGLGSCFDLVKQINCSASKICTISKQNENKSYDARQGCNNT